MCYVHDVQAQLPKEVLYRHVDYMHACSHVNTSFRHVVYES